MEIVATIARSYKKILYGLYGTIYGSWIWLPRKVNPGLCPDHVQTCGQSIGRSNSSISVWKLPAVRYNWLEVSSLEILSGVILVSVFYLLLVAVDRYLSVIFPFFHKIKFNTFLVLNSGLAMTWILGIISKALIPFMVLVPLYR